jgi:nucleoside-diphosphate-sugar epimerase
MKIMITGGSGYFGTELNKYLTSLGYEVFSYDAGFFRNNFLGPKIDLKEKWIDARDISEFEIEKFDAVVHFAGISNDPVKQLSEDELHRPSIKYTKNIADMCKKLNKTFIFASSCSVYGYSELVVDETSETNPLTPYSQAKNNIEQILNKLATPEWKPILLRFATIFGFSSRMRFDTVINMFCGMTIVNNEISLNSNGRAVRPFLYLPDACKAVEKFLSPSLDFAKLESNNQIIVNVGKTENNYSINQIAEKINIFQDSAKIASHKSIHSRPEVFQDSKIHNGADKRSYSVSFDKFENYVESPNFFTDFFESLNNTIYDLKMVNLKYEDFVDTKFYRLQYLEKFFKDKSHEVNQFLDS